MSADHDHTPLAAFARRVLVAIALAALAFLLWRAVDILFLVLGGVVAAVLLRACAEPVARRTPLSDRQAVVAAGDLDRARARARRLARGARSSAPRVSDLLDRVPQAWQGLQDRLGVGALGEGLRGLAAAGSGPGGVLASLVGYATTLGGALVNLILVLIGGVFFAIRPDLYREGLVKLVPGEAARARVADTLDTCGRALRAWLLGQLVSMAIVGALTWLGLWLIGVPAAFALALLASLAEFVPMVGPAAATAPRCCSRSRRAGARRCGHSPSTPRCSRLESNLITPLVQRETVELPPALTLFGVVAFGVGFGPLGLVLAVPALVVAYVAVKKLWVRHARRAHPGAGRG